MKMKIIENRIYPVIVLFIFLILLCTACESAPQPQLTSFSHTPTSTSSITPLPPTQIYSPTTTSTTFPSKTPIPTQTQSPIPSPFLSLTPMPTHLPCNCPWDRYLPRTIASILEETVSEVKPGSDLIMWLNYGDSYPSKIVVKFTGEFRPIREPSLKIIQMWAQNFYNLPSDKVNELFVREGKFIENDVEYWMPVQDHLITFMQDEIGVGQEFEILIVWLGVLSEDNSSRWIFIVNNF